MKIIFHKNFEKDYKNLSAGLKIKLKERNLLFLNDPYNPTLNNHALHGKYLGYRSFNITGDIRVIYKLLDKDVAIFSAVGPHNKLYS